MSFNLILFKFSKIIGLDSVVEWKFDGKWKIKMEKFDDVGLDAPTE